MLRIFHFCLVLALAAAPSLAQVTGPVVATVNLDGRPDQPLYTESWYPAHPKAVLVFSHGFIDNARNHRRMYAALTGAGYAVTAWDQVGHGTSFGMRGYVDRFDTFVRALD